ncbi:MAG: hypothetical protein PW792_04720 [Acidobacteriaceae bacterium]|nr:hypothetical protein [Acidobacteriaceae bacterium]
MYQTKIEITYVWGATIRIRTAMLPIRHAENAYPWLKARLPTVKILDTRKVA